MSRIILTAATIAAFINIAVARPSHSRFRRAATHDAIVQMFQWNWDSVAKECTDFIGPAGYAYVQVSPAQETIQGTQWWTDYQAVSYILNNKRGNRTQFQNMVTTCHAAGVKVLADIIVNHMAGIDSGTGSAGSSFTHYNYPGIYQYQDFHHCGTPNDAIIDWSNRTQVQFCELTGLADLATESEYVKAKLASHANDLLSLGVDGFRIDAAKHVPASDLSNILGRLNTKPSYITQEVYYGGGAGVQPSEYTGMGNVEAFQFAFDLQTAFESGGISSLQDLESKGWMSGSAANTFVANQDTERNNGTLSVPSPSNAYTLAHILMLTHPYGTPTVLSSYSFSNSDDGAPNGNYGTCTGNGGSNGWYCQHRWTAIVGALSFHNAVGSETMTNWVSPSAQKIAYGRGAVGFVAINNEDTAWGHTFATSLPSGTYCDVVSGSLNSGHCTGASIVVASDGSFTTTVSNRNAIAIHIGAKI